MGSNPGLMCCPMFQLLVSHSMTHLGQLAPIQEIVEIVVISDDQGIKEFLAELGWPPTTGVETNHMNTERKINYCDTIFGKQSARISEHSRSLLSTPGKKTEKIGNSGEIIFDAFAGLQNKSRASVRGIEWGSIPQKHRNKCRSHRNLDMVYKLDSIS